MLRELLSLLGFGTDTSSTVSTRKETTALSVTSTPQPPTAEAGTTPRSSLPKNPVSETDTLVIVGEDGNRYSILERTGVGISESLLLGREDGSQVTVSLNELTRQENGFWLLSDALRDSRGLVIPVVEEQLEVSKQQVETARVRVKKSVESRDVVVDEPLKRERVVVDHVPFNTVVTGEVPQVREADGVTIIPILEERVVTQTELVLVEEVHIRRESSEYHAPQTVALRREVVEVERLEPDEASGKI